MTTNHKARQSPSARRRALKTVTTTSARNLSRGRAVHINVDGGLVADSTTLVSSAEHSAPAWVAAIKTTAAASPEAVGNETLSAQTQLASLSTYELIALISDQLDHRPELSPVSTKVAALLHLSPALAGEAEALGTRFIDSTVKQAGIETAARHWILDQPMYTAAEVATALGRSSSDRSVAARLRDKAAIVGLPVANSYRYPQFQFDLPNLSVREEVAEVNALLDAPNDPWGVASWWFSPSGRLPDGQSPADLATSDDASERRRLPTLANAVLAD